jgi:hypothetical protein
LGASVRAPESRGDQQIETDRAKTSKVEVRFISEARDRTRVELENQIFILMAFSRAASVHATTHSWQFRPFLSEIYVATRVFTCARAR